MSEFIDRKSSNINKKILDVEKVELDETGTITRLYVKEYRNDDPVKTDGTPLNAESLNKIISEMIIDERNMIINNLLTTEEKLNLDKRNINLPTSTFLDIELQESGYFGSSFSWSILSGTGMTIKDNLAIVKRTSQKQNVVLRVEIKNESVIEFKDFTITIPAFEYDSNHKEIFTDFNIFPDGSSASIDSRTIKIEENSIAMLENEYSDLFSTRTTIDGNNNLTITVSAGSFPDDGGVNEYNFKVIVYDKLTGKTKQTIYCTVNFLESLYPED